VTVAVVNIVRVPINYVITVAIANRPVDPVYVDIATVRVEDESIIISIRVITNRVVVVMTIDAMSITSPNITSVTSWSMIVDCSVINTSWSSISTSCSHCSSRT
jgi:hypothetical protein